MENLQEYSDYNACFDCMTNSGVSGVCKQTCSIIELAIIKEEPYKSRYKYIIRNDKYLIEFETSPEVEVGDKILVSGTLAPDLTDKRNKNFRLIDSSIKTIYKVEDTHYFSTQNTIRRLAQFVEHLSKIVRSRLPSTHSSLLAGIIFGHKESFSNEFYNYLINTGTIHIVAASGYNITVLAGAVIAIFTLFLSRKLAVLFSLFSIVVYVFISGGSEAVIRAAIMGSMLFLSQFFGRIYYPIWSLLLAVVMMLLFDPTLVGSISLQLSVASTLGIMLIPGWLQNYFPRSDNLKILEKITTFFREDFITTLSAYIVTLPIILIYFDRISIVSIIVNILVLWVVPPLMFFGSLMIFFGLFSQVLSKFVSYFTWPFLEYFIKVVTWWGSLPISSVEIENISPVFAVGYYFVLISVLMMKRPKNTDL
ncbi:ComEC/Rec2 family competence protein [Patescibacteria group bacterium]